MINISIRWQIRQCARPLKVQYLVAFIQFFATNRYFVGSIVVLDVWATCSVKLLSRTTDNITIF